MVVSNALIGLPNLSVPGLRYHTFQSISWQGQGYLLFRWVFHPFPIHLPEMLTELLTLAIFHFKAQSDVHYRAIYLPLHGDGVAISFSFGASFACRRGNRSSGCPRRPSRGHTTKPGGEKNDVACRLVHTPAQIRTAGSAHTYRWFVDRL